MGWLRPGLLAGTAVRVLLAELFGGYLDKRELQAAFSAASYDHSAAAECWLDFTADAGDGFDATYTVAYQLARRQLVVDGAGTLPRGEVLVLGGDQVYPTASMPAYVDRWKGPYRSALPELAADSPTLYALPGNHDWYDGLTAFLRLFAQGDPVGGWRTRQARSYFAVKLPHDWWLFAVDIQLSSYVDKPQLQYFEAIAAELGPANRIILCSAKPSWLMTDDYPDAYDSLDFFVRTIIEPTAARVPLFLTGDMHHYARYSGEGPDGTGRQLITCGGGGAYLMGTDHLPREVTVPPPASTVRNASDPRLYRQAASYPTKTQSRRLGWRIFTRLPVCNPGFVGLVGVIQTLLMLALLTSPAEWRTAATGFAVAAVFAGTILLATVLGHRGRKHLIAGTVHALPHIGLGILGAWAWTHLPLADAPAPWDTVLAFVVYLPVAGLLDTWLVGLYLVLARYVRINVNELYAGLGIEDHKSFLRMHLGPDGALTIYPIAVEKAVRRWRADPSAAADAPWIAPETPSDLAARLIERPITIR